MEKEVVIRNVQAEDYFDLTDLALQLGYPCIAEDVQERISRYIGNDSKAIIVAESDGRVIGWASVEVIDHFYLDPFAEISGFVVDEAHRGLGIGNAIMNRIEIWVKERDLSLLRLKTNAIRKDAHRFYERLGFVKTKEQLVYTKMLGKE
jgi:GNAT superfamily N-acetyltransferase